MFKIPFDALLISVIISPLITYYVASRLFRSRPRQMRYFLSMLLTVLAFGPIFLITCFLIEPLYTYRGQGAPETVPRVFHVPPPEEASSVRYFKNTVFESYACELPEYQFEAWCDSHDLRENTSRMKLGHQTFVPKGTTAASRMYESRTVAPNGAFHLAAYFREHSLMVYEASYW